jgi:hypothetical protein
MVWDEPSQVYANLGWQGGGYPGIADIGKGKIGQTLPLINADDTDPKKAHSRGRLCHMGMAWDRSL